MSAVGSRPAWSESFLSDGVQSDAHWLADRRRRLDSGEAEWLEVLARFDCAGGWATDGQLCCVDWLMWRAGLGRATAFEKLRVAHELRRRPVLAAALAAGRASYSAIRAMVRAEGACTDVDEAFVAVAEAGTVADVERAVAAYLLYASQERRPSELERRRELRMKPIGDGLVKVEAIITDVEAAELEAALSSSMAEAVDESTRVDSSTGSPEPRDWPVMRVDALMDLARGGLGAGHAVGADRYMVHVVVRHPHAGLLGGDALDSDTRARIACDCTTVTHHLDALGAPLALGRRQRAWSAAQRRAVTVRDGGHCRWPGCRRRHVDIHHLRPWEAGGATDVANGICLCPRHHHRLHDGFSATGDANGTLTFHRRDASPLGASRGQVA